MNTTVSLEDRILQCLAESGVDGVEPEDLIDDVFLGADDDDEPDDDFTEQVNEAIGALIDRGLVRPIRDDDGEERALAFTHEELARRIAIDLASAGLVNRPQAATTVPERVERLLAGRIGSEGEEEKHAPTFHPPCSVPGCDHEDGARGAGVSEEGVRWLVVGRRYACLECGAVAEASGINTWVHPESPCSLYAPASSLGRGYVLQVDEVAPTRPSARIDLAALRAFARAATAVSIDPSTPSLASAAQQLADALEAERRGHALEPPHRRDAREHTGATAVWCPVCGDCSCPYVDDVEDNGRTFEHPLCPLHGTTTTHPMSDIAETCSACGEESEQLLTTGAAGSSQLCVRCYQAAAEEAARQHALDHEAWKKALADREGDVAHLNTEVADVRDQRAADARGFRDQIADRDRDLDLLRCELVAAQALVAEYRATDAIASKALSVSQGMRDIAQAEADKQREGAAKDRAELEAVRALLPPGGEGTVSEQVKRLIDTAREERERLLARAKARSWSLMEMTKERDEALRKALDRDERLAIVTSELDKAVADRALAEKALATRRETEAELSMRLDQVTRIERTLEAIRAGDGTLASKITDLTRELDDARATVERMKPVVDAAFAWQNVTRGGIVDPDLLLANALDAYRDGDRS